jgi:paraquat-inducible protein B
VELDFVDPHEYPVPGNAESDKYVVVPAIRGAFSEAQANLLEISNKLKRVDYEGLARDFRTLLASSNRKVSELDVKTLNEMVGRAADAVTNLAGSEEIKQTLANLNATLAAARSAMEKLDGQVGPVSDDLRKTLASAQSALKTLESTAATTRRFVQQQGQVGDELTTALRQVAEAASALENLSSAIERNPSSLLVGKKKKDDK